MPQFESPVFKTAIRNKAIPTLKVPVPLYKEKDQPIKSRHVLTSKENLEAMEQKQKLKEEEIKIKAERKLQREAKKREKQERELSRRKPRQNVIVEISHLQNLNFSRGDLTMDMI